MRILFQALVATAMVVGTARAESPLREGDAAFTRGLEIAGSDPVGAKGRFAEAAAAWRGAIEASPARATGRLWANLGNAYALSGDVGRAVACYRRALRLDPRDEVANAGLAVARSRVGVAITPNAASRAERWMLSWRGTVPRWAWWWGAGSLWTVGWIALGIRVVRARPGFGGFGVLALVGAGVCAGPVLAERWVDSDREAVVVDVVIGREGPSDSIYAASFDGPVVAGVEVRVMEMRGGWSRVRLSDGRETWIPQGTLERL